MSIYKYIYIHTYISYTGMHIQTYIYINIVYIYEYVCTPRKLYIHISMCVYEFICVIHIHIYEFCPNAFLNQELPLHSGILFASPAKLCTPLSQDSLPFTVSSSITIEC